MKGSLSHLARPGAEITLRATPGAARERVVAAEDGLRLYVTAPAEGGKANAAITRLLARALGVPKSRLTLVRGAGARIKTFRILGS